MRHLEQDVAFFVIVNLDDITIRDGTSSLCGQADNAYGSLLRHMGRERIHDEDYSDLIYIRCGVIVDEMKYFEFPHTLHTADDVPCALEILPTPNPWCLRIVQPDNDVCRIEQNP